MSRTLLLPLVAVATALAADQPKEIIRQSTHNWVTLHLGHDTVPSDAPGQSFNQQGQSIEIDMMQVQARDPKNLQIRMVGGTIYEIYYADYPMVVDNTGGAATK